jgi:hypothetical protein
VSYGLKTLTSSHHETEGSGNRGNFIELLSPLPSIDPDFKKQCRAVPSNIKYTSPEIQNELISITTSKIREDICYEATDASIIAIMVDDSIYIFLERSR